MDTWEPPPPDKEQKFCKKCQQWKSVTEFHKRGANSKYLAGYCKKCHDQPFQYEAIRCPHCKEKITFFGVDGKGNITKQRNEVLAKLKKQAKESLKVKNVKKEEAALKEKLDLKDIF